MFPRIEQPDPHPDRTWQGDLFDRKKYADQFCQLLRSTKGSSVLGVNAPYGFGKTFFLKRLQQEVQKERAWAIYVNAWEYDYLDNTLFGLLDALKVAAQSIPGASDAKNSLKEVAVASAPTVAKAAGKAIVSRLLGSAGTEEIIDLFEDLSGAAAEVFAEKLLKADTTHQSLKLLRTAIHDFVENNLDDQSPYKTLLIIVDELDRARPNFSIRFLETIKHIFGAARVIFIIACDRKVLEASAKHHYGADLPVDGYLRRLFDYWVELPPPDAKKYIFYCAHQLDLIKDGIAVETGSIRKSIDGYARLLLRACGEEAISLRFIEQSVAHAAVVLRLSSTEREVGLIGWLQGLRHAAPDIYSEYVSNKPVSRIVRVLTEFRPFALAEDREKAWIIFWATNTREVLNEELRNKLFGTPSPLSASLEKVMHNEFELDHESFAHLIDKRMKAFSVYR